MEKKKELMKTLKDDAHIKIGKSRCNPGLAESNACSFEHAENGWNAVGHTSGTVTKQKYELEIWKVVGAGASYLITITQERRCSPPRNSYREETKITTTDRTLGESITSEITRETG